MQARAGGGCGRSGAKEGDNEEEGPPGVSEAEGGGDLDDGKRARTGLQVGRLAGAATLLRTLWRSAQAQ